VAVHVHSLETLLVFLPASSNPAAFSRGHLAALGGADTAGHGTSSAVVPTVNATLLRAPFAHLSAECADILEVSTVSRYCTDAELTKLQTLVAAYGAIIIARLGRHSLDTLLAPQDAFLAGLDTLAIGFVQLRHERSPFLHPFFRMAEGTVNRGQYLAGCF